MFALCGNRIRDVLRSRRVFPPLRHIGRNISLNTVHSLIKITECTDAPVEHVNKSRLETRLQQLNNDEKTLQSVKHLQDSVRTEKNPWAEFQDSSVYNSHR
jgi:hypothetical protein